MPLALLFLIGLVITAAVLGAFAVLIWAEIQDGRTEAAAAARRDHDLDETVAAR